MEPCRLDDAFRLEIDDLLDGGATTADPTADDLVRWEALASRLEADAAVRAYLAERSLLHAALARSLTRRRLGQWAVEHAQATVEPRSSAARVTRRWAVAGLAALAAVVAVVLIVPAGQGRPCATVMRGIGTGVPVAGTALGREPHELAAGVLELATQRGGRVVIEAPASFRFESAQRLRLVHGRVSADIPPAAKGFTVVTPSGEAIDLGTRFAVDVPLTGKAEVHVFSGEVIARGDATPARSLRDGDAYSLATNSARELRSAAFISGDEVGELAAAVADGRERVSRDAAARLQADPALVAWLDFEGRGASAAAGQCRFVQGRWPGSRAADFTEVGDHIPIDVGAGEDYEQVTLAAWVRLDRLGAPFQSLYHTDGWEADNPGQVHWMLTQSGVMRLALRGIQLAPNAIERQGHPDSRSPVLGEKGRWIHLAAVYDSGAKTARFYVNGEFDSETTLAVAPPARLGAARIGNWNTNDRRLSGRIDEFCIVGRALGDEEIRAIHASGNPYEVARR